jgi:hypothetical protein
MAETLPCVISFIKIILCANPILKGAWITLLNSIILQLQEQIAILTFQVNQLNVLNTLTGLGINTAKALINKVSSDLNLFLGPLQSYPDCSVLGDLNTTIQYSSVGQKLRSYNKKIHEFQRATNLSNILSAQKKKLDQRIVTLQDMLNKINQICP